LDEELRALLRLLADANESSNSKFLSRTELLAQQVETATKDLSDANRRLLEALSKREANQPDRDARLGNAALTAFGKASNSAVVGLVSACACALALCSRWDVNGKGSENGPRGWTVLHGFPAVAVGIVLIGTVLAVFLHTPFQEHARRTLMRESVDGTCSLKDLMARTGAYVGFTSWVLGLCWLVAAVTVVLRVGVGEFGSLTEPGAALALFSGLAGVQLRVQRLCEEMIDPPDQLEASEESS
jgi:hypothetical protein